MTLSSLKKYPDNRKIALDLETTGLNVMSGDRVLSIGMVEIIDDRLTGKSYYQEFNPQKSFIDSSSVEIHGLKLDYLKNKPFFKERAKEILDFIGDSTVLIHNVHFDSTFLKREFEYAGFDPSNILKKTICTVELARNVLPIFRVSLDRLCLHFGINQSNRTYHNALEDAKLVAQVYYYLNTKQNFSGKRSIFDIPEEQNFSFFKNRKKLLKIDIEALTIFRDSLL